MFVHVSAVLGLCAAFGTHGKSGDVMLEAAAAADAALHVASHARPGIEDWSETVTAIGQRIVGRPLMDKERLPRLGHGRIDRLGTPRPPGEVAQPQGRKRQQANQQIPEWKGTVHGNTPAAKRETTTRGHRTVQAAW